MSIQKSFNQIQGLASFAWTIHDNLAIRAMTDVSKHFKVVFSAITNTTIIVPPF